MNARLVGLHQSGFLCTPLGLRQKGRVPPTEVTGMGAVSWRPQTHTPRAVLGFSVTPPAGEEGLMVFLPSSSLTLPRGRKVKTAPCSNRKMFSPPDK